jgi:hypothetical protein
MVFIVINWRVRPDALLLSCAIVLAVSHLGAHPPAFLVFENFFVPINCSYNPFHGPIEPVFIH